MSQIAQDVVVKNSVSDVLENFEAFLWADSAEKAEDGGRGDTTAVRKLNRTTFEETETIDLLFFRQEIVTRYVVKADPKGARISISINGGGLLNGLIQIADALGGDPSGEGSVNAEVRRWGERLEKFVTGQKQASNPHKGVA